MTAVIPDAGELRGRIREFRRSRSTETLFSTLGRLYEIGLYVFITGGLTIQSVARITAPAVDSSALDWIVTPLALVCVGAGLRVLTAIGPVCPGPATHGWLLATPVARGALLRGTVRTAVGVSMLAGVTAAALITASTRPDLPTFLLTTATGAAIGCLLAGVAVLGQAVGHTGSLTRATRLLTGSGLVIGLWHVGEKAVGRDPTGGGAPLVVVAVVLFPAAVAAYRSAVRQAPRLTRAALVRGADLLTALRVSATFRNLSFISSAIHTRRWRAVGALPSRRLAGTGFTALVRAESVRLRRQRRELLIAAAAALTPLGASVFVATPWVAVVSLLVGRFAVGQLAGGLRTVRGNEALRRALALSDWRIELAHLAIPLVVTLCWTAVAFPVLGFGMGALLTLPVFILGTVYLGTAKSEPVYAGPVVDTPFGMVETTLLLQVLRGPAVLFVLCAIQLAIW